MTPPWTDVTFIGVKLRRCREPSTNAPRRQDKTGAKFEEILVVTDSRDPVESAFWLDEDLPHVRCRQEEVQAV